MNQLCTNWCLKSTNKRGEIVYEVTKVVFMWNGRKMLIPMSIEIFYILYSIFYENCVNCFDYGYENPVSGIKIMCK